MEARAYAQAKSACDHAKNRADLPRHPMIDLVTRIEFDLAQEDIARG